MDSTNIGLFGSGIAGTACIRAAILHQQSVKALGLPAPYVHSFYTDPKILNSLPLCLRSSFCNRLDLDASNWDLVIPRFKAFSLKTQGLLSASGRCAVPTLICATERSVVTKMTSECLRITSKMYPLCGWRMKVMQCSSRL